MTAVEFHNLLASPESLTSSSLEELVELYNKYPFSSLLAALVAKKAYQTNAENKTSLITNAALQAPSRAQLKHFVEELPSAPVPVEIGTSQIPEEEITDVETANDTVVETERPIETVFDEPPSLDKVDQQIQAANYTAELEEEIRALEAFDVDEQIDKANQVRPTDERSILKEDVSNDESSQTFMSWIDNLDDKNVAEETNITGTTNRLDEDFDVSHVAAIAGQSSTINNGIYTETLATIYEEQSKWKRAIEVYQGLSLKHPEKSGYFAARIAALQDKII